MAAASIGIATAAYYSPVDLWTFLICWGAGVVSAALPMVLAERRARERHRPRILYPRDYEASPEDLQEHLPFSRRPLRSIDWSSL
jgi:hypothetical protein